MTTSKRRKNAMPM